MYARVVGESGAILDQVWRSLGCSILTSLVHNRCLRKSKKVILLQLYLFITIVSIYKVKRIVYKFHLSTLFPLLKLCGRAENTLQAISMAKFRSHISKTCLQAIFLNSASEYASSTEEYTYPLSYFSISSTYRMQDSWEAYTKTKVLVNPKLKI